MNFRRFIQNKDEIEKKFTHLMIIAKSNQPIDGKPVLTLRNQLTFWIFDVGIVTVRLHPYSRIFLRYNKALEIKIR